MEYVLLANLNQLMISYFVLIRNSTGKVTMPGDQHLLPESPELAASIIYHHCHVAFLGFVDSEWIERQ